MASSTDNIDKLKAANSKLRTQISNLREELAEAKELLQAIKEGSVDAFVVENKGESQIFTLAGAERPFRIVVETMNEGAATLTIDGVILYCNNQFAKILDAEPNAILGRNINEFLNEQNRSDLDRMAKGCYHHKVRGELTLHRQGERKSRFMRHYRL